MKRSLEAALMLVLCCASACSYTTTASAPARGELWIDDKLAGDVGPAGEDVKVPITYADPPWLLYLDDDDVPDASGVLTRTRLDPLPTASLCGASALTTPCCMSAGFCLANPSALVLLLAPLSEVFLLSGLNAARTSLDNPSWPTLPVMMACAVCGLLPLALLPFALRVPDEVSLTGPAPAASLPPVSGVLSEEVRY